jgi:hypothetical protein
MIGFLLASHMNFSSFFSFDSTCLVFLSSILPPVILVSVAYFKAGRR